MSDVSVPRKILQGAVEVLKRDGWVQKVFGIDGKPSCLIGAMWKAEERLHPTPSQEDFMTAKRAITNALGDPHRYSVVQWNDAPGRKVEEVFDVLKKADELLAQDSPST